MSFVDLLNDKFYKFCGDSFLTDRHFYDIMGLLR